MGPQRTNDTVILLGDAPIFVLPDATRQPLRVGKEGSVLTLLEQKGEWCSVEFQDPQFGRRAGYVQSKYVKVNIGRLQPIDLSVASVASPSAPTRIPSDQNADRQVPAVQRERAPQPVVSCMGGPPITSKARGVAGVTVGLDRDVRSYVVSGGGGGDHAFALGTFTHRTADSSDRTAVGALVAGQALFGSHAQSTICPYAGYGYEWRRTGLYSVNGTSNEFYGGVAVAGPINDGTGRIVPTASIEVQHEITNVVVGNLLDVNYPRLQARAYGSTEVD